MKRWALLLAAGALAAGCGGGEHRKPIGVSKDPVSVRGWIADVEGSARSATPEIESNRLSQIYQATQIWIDNVDYVSGGVAPNGSFILLDVPPGNVTIELSAPGVEHARIVLQNIPGNADVLIPAVILKANGASVYKPERIQVRLPARIDKPAPTGKTALVAGVQVPVMEVPIAQLVDRHDYPVPEGFHTVATFK